MRPPIGSLGQCVHMLGLALFLCTGAPFMGISAAVTQLDLYGGLKETCPAPTPVLEQETGRSLFWQDICGQGYRHDGFLFHDSIRPMWYSSGESVALFRDEQGALVQPQVAGGTLSTGNNDFDSEYENGAQLLVGRSLGDWYRIEFLWLGTYEWADTHAAQTTDELESIGFDTRMNNSEINLRRRVRILDWPKYYGAMEFSTLLGFRYLSLDENLNYIAQTNVATNMANVRTDNNMFGVQVGTLAQLLFEDRGWIDIEFKGGILANEVDVASFYTPAPGTPATFTGNENRTSFVVDVSLMLNYQFTPAWTVRIGYSAIWLDGIALASQNISSDATLPLINVDHSGETVYHGPSIGLVYAPKPHAVR